MNILKLFRKKEKVPEKVWYSAYPKVKLVEGLSSIEKANKILKHQKDLEKCKEAEICPVCGEKLLIKSWEEGYGLHVVTYCSKDETHYCDLDYVC